MLEAVRDVRRREPRVFRASDELFLLCQPFFCFLLSMEEAMDALDSAHLQSQWSS